MRRIKGDNKATCASNDFFNNLRDNQLPVALKGNNTNCNFINEFITEHIVDNADYVV